MQTLKSAFWISNPKQGGLMQESRDNTICLIDNISKAAKVSKPDHPRLCPPGVHFTRREGHCFFLLTRVTTVKKIAQILELSPRTVEMYICQLKSKLGLSYKSELIELAVRLVAGARDWRLET